MTLQNGLVMGDTAYLWSDTGWFDPATGALKLIGGKVLQGLTFPFAVSFSSNGGNPYMMFDAIEARFPISLPALLEGAVEGLRAYAATGHVGTLLVAAWEDEPRLFLIRSFDGLSGHDESAFEPIEVLHHICNGAGSPELEALRSAGLSRRRMHRVNDLLASRPFDYHESFGVQHGRRGIGGTIVETTVTRGGVRNTVIRTLDEQAAAA